MAKSSATVRQLLPLARPDNASPPPGFQTVPSESLVLPRGNQVALINYNAWFNPSTNELIIGGTPRPTAMLGPLENPDTAKDPTIFFDTSRSTSGPRAGSFLGRSIAVDQTQDLASALTDSFQGAYPNATVTFVGEGAVGLAFSVASYNLRTEAAFNGGAYAERATRNAAGAVQISQPLWRPGLRIGPAQAELQVKLAKFSLQSAEIELMLRSSQAYFDVLVAQQSVQVAHNQEGAVKEQLALASENFQAGLTTVADVHEARARLALAQAQHVAARTELAGRHAEMHRLLGAPPPKLAGLAQGAQPATLEPAALEAWMDRADADNPQLRAQQLAVEVASQEVHRQAQAHGPSLDLSLGLARNSTTGSMTSPSELASRSHSTQVGVQLVIPIYAGGAVQSRVREAIAAREKAEADLEAVHGQLLSQLRQAHAGVVNGQAQAQALAMAAAASQAALDANRIGYRLGTRINIDVLNAQQQQYATQRDLYKARTEIIMQNLRLKAAAGQLAESDLLAISALLESEP